MLPWDFNIVCLTYWDIHLKSAAASTSSDVSRVPSRPYHRRRSLVNCFVVSRLDYCISLLAGVPQVTLDRLQRDTNAAARMLCSVGRRAHVSDLLRNRLHWLRVPQRIQFKLCLLMYKSLHGMAPDYLKELCRSVSEDDARGSLRSAERGDLIVLSATEHSPSEVLWRGTACQRQSEIPAPCQPSNLLWRLICLFHYILEAAATVMICDDRCHWIGFTCYGAIEIIVVLLLLLLFDKRSKYCKFKMEDGRHIENLFGYISAPYWLINAKFGPEMKNHMPI